MKKIAVLCDTSFTQECQQLKDVYFVPIGVTLTENGKEVNYDDSITITPHKVTEYFEQGNTKISTAAVPIGVITAKVEELLKDYDEVIGICLSSKLSRTHENFKMVESEFGGQFKTLPVDLVITLGEWLVRDVLKMIAEGKSYEEIEKHAKAYEARALGGVVVPNLTQLIAGGRLTGVKAFFAKALQFKLVIGFYKGSLDLWDKSRKIEESVNLLLDEIDKRNDWKTKGIKRVSFIPSDIDNKEILHLCQIVSKATHTEIKDIDLRQMATCIMAHTGNDSIAIMIEPKE